MNLLRCGIGLVEVAVLRKASAHSQALDIRNPVAAVAPASTQAIQANVQDVPPGVGREGRQPRVWRDKWREAERVFKNLTEHTSENGYRRLLFTDGVPRCLEP